ncbi:MAG: SH3 domain-containing protein [Bacillota bacterium]
MKKGWTNRDNTRMLREADHGADLLRMLPKNTELEVLEERDRFTKVQLRDGFSDLVGYVYSGFLEVEATDLPEPSPRDQHLLPCPRCGAEAWGAFPLAQMGGHGSQNYYISTGFLSYVAVQARVCLRCGYLELCVKEDGLPELRRIASEKR